MVFGIFYLLKPDTNDFSITTKGFRNRSHRSFVCFVFGWL